VKSQFLKQVKVSTIITELIVELWKGEEIADERAFCRFGLILKIALLVVQFGKKKFELFSKLP